ncbi:MAG TPA: alpha/beta fold hydrolase [Anaerolineales bacterium]|nr:alpha/beta fold hydrolase [Anaerolineales bacterium]
MRKLIAWLAVLFLLAVLLPACLVSAPAPTQTSVRTATQAVTATVLPTGTPTAAPAVSPTPDPYYTWSNAYLRSRSYGGGQIEFLEVVDQNAFFTRYLIRYPSDGLNIYGFANIPNDNEVHPVIIALHGYIDPAIYNTLDYTTHYADALASAGYIVFHPNLRGYRPSQDGENLFRVGMAIDVLNLIALVKSQSGLTDQLRNANSDAIGMWGHSMGGGITTRVITVSEDVKAAVLYAAMSGDEQKNYAAIREWSGQTRGLEELNVPIEALTAISPMYFFANITAAVSIHHGTADGLVPLDWSVTTCGELQLLGKDVQCQYYENMPHTFYGDGDQEFIQNTIQFFNEKLKSS